MRELIRFLKVQSDTVFKVNSELQNTCFSSIYFTRKLCFCSLLSQNQALQQIACVSKGRMLVARTTVRESKDKDCLFA